MTPEELDQIKELIKNHTPRYGDFGFVTLLILLAFIGGCFKDCGY